jgi:lipid-A-disaccharide synthase-like uncharacterized protein
LRPPRGVGTALVVLAALLALIAAAPALAQTTGQPSDGRGLSLKIRPAGVTSVVLLPQAEGGYLYTVTWRDGHTADLSPDEFADLLHRDYAGRRPLFRLLNISSAAGIGWVAFGLLSQVLFAGRMAVQLFVSERQGRSVVPVAFWWISIAGACMLLIYFVWRRDIVGVLGQSASSVVYVRNLWLIYRRQDGGPRESPVA